MLGWRELEGRERSEDMSSSLVHFTVAELDGFGAGDPPSPITYSCFRVDGKDPKMSFPLIYPQNRILMVFDRIIMNNTSRTLKFTLLTLFHHDTCGLQRIGLTRPFCLAGTARSDFHTR